MAKMFFTWSLLFLRSKTPYCSTSIPPPRFPTHLCLRYSLSDILLSTPMPYFSRSTNMFFYQASLSGLLAFHPTLGAQVVVPSKSLASFLTFFLPLYNCPHSFCNTSVKVSLLTNPYSRTLYGYS